MSDARRLSLGAALTAGSIVFTAVPAAATAPEMPRHFSTVRQHAPATHGSLAIATVPVRAVAPTAAPTMTYQVQSGDTVWAIAQRTGATVSTIISANGLSANALIRPGQVLTIPSAASAGTSSSPAPSAPAATKSVTIKAGDTLSGLARTHGTTVQALMSANGLTNHIIIAGRTLSIPGTGNTTTVPQRVGNTFLHYTYPDHVVAAANVNLDALLKSGVPSRAQMQSQVRETAVSMGLDPALALAVAMKESGFNHASVSPANAIGTMQVIPSSGEWASNLVGYKLNLLNPKDNVVAGVAILRQLVRTSPNLDHAIASYYQGQGSVNRNGMASDTKQYVAGVRSFMTQFGG